MPQFSPDGRFVLSSDTLPWSSLNWAWLTPTTAIGYGAFNQPDVGLWTYDYATGARTRLGDCGFRLQRGIYADGRGHWLADLINGTLDSERREFGAGRLAAGMSPDGDQVFIRTPDFAALIVRRPDGTEVVHENGEVQTSTVRMRDGVLLWRGGGTYHALDRVLPITEGTDWRLRGRWLTGYVSGWGLALWNIDGDGHGYWLSADGNDFYPDVFDDGHGIVRVVSASTQGDTGVRMYECDLAGQRYRRNDGPWTPLVPVDLRLSPPAPALEAPDIPDFGRQVGVGYFKLTTAARQVDGPGHFELLTDGVPWSSVRDKSRPIIADVASAMSVPAEKLIAIFDEIRSGHAAAARAFADRLQIPVIWYSDHFPYFDASAERVPLLRPHDYLMVKSYPTESAAQIAAELDRLVTVHPRLSVAWPVYTQAWNIETVIAHQRPLADVVRARPAVHLIGLFCGGARDNGVGTYPVLADCGARVIAASQGMPDLGTGHAAPVDPKPEPAPIPPQPRPPSSTTSFFARARATGAHMDTKRGYLVDNGRFTGIEPNNPKGEGDLAYPVYADREQGNGWELVELTKVSATEVSARYVEANRYLCLTANDGRQSRAAVGPWETLQAAEQPDGTILVYRKHDGRLVDVLEFREAA